MGKQPKPVSKAPIVKAKKASAGGTTRKGLTPPVNGPKPSFRDAGGTLK
jgi:hypothetical protein